VSFFYGDTKAGAPTITANAGAGPLTVTQQETIVAAAASKIVFTTVAFSGTASATATSGTATLQRQDQFGNPTTPASALSVALSSNSAGTAVFSLTSGGTTVTSVSIASGNSSVSFFYGDTKAGAPTITANAGAGPLTGTQQETIVAAAATVMAFVNCADPGASYSSATCAGQPIAMGNNTTLTANVGLFDNFGNPSAPSSTVTVALSSSSQTTYAVSPASVTVVPPSSVSAQFSVAKNNTTGTGTITASATGFTSITLQLKK
jgi:hypothetical protein